MPSHVKPVVPQISLKRIKASRCGRLVLSGRICGLSIADAPVSPYIALPTAMENPSPYIVLPSAMANISPYIHLPFIMENGNISFMVIFSLVAPNLSDICSLFAALSAESPDILVFSEYSRPIRFIISELYSPKNQAVTNTENISPDLKADPYMENLS